MSNEFSNAWFASLGQAGITEDIFEEAQPPSPVRSLADMSEAEIVALEKKYGCAVRRTRR